MSTNVKERLSLRNIVSLIGLTSLVGIIVIVISVPFAIFMLLSIDAVKVLIEGIATLLGFFGLFAIYLLTSYDSRIDNIQDRIEDCDDDEKITRLKDNYEKIKTKKQANTFAILAGLSSWVISFFVSLLLLSLLSIIESSTASNAIVLFILSFASSLFLLIGVFAIFGIIYRIGKEPDGYYFKPKLDVNETKQDTEQYMT